MLALPQASQINSLPHPLADLASQAMEAPNSSLKQLALGGSLQSKMILKRFFEQSISYQMTRLPTLRETYL